MTRSPRGPGTGPGRIHRSHAPGVRHDRVHGLDGHGLLDVERHGGRASARRVPGPGPSTPHPHAGSGLCGSDLPVLPSVHARTRAAEHADTVQRQHYHQIHESYDRRYLSSLATRPVLDAAGGLLDAWCATAGERGVDMAGAYPGGEWAERLAAVALEMTSRRVREPRPRTPEEATALLDAVVTRLAERGIGTHRDMLYVPLPRTDITPAWGAFEPCRLAITIDIERGWELAIDQPTASPVVELVGQCDETGIDAMLDLATAVNTGAYGNIFHH